MTAPLCPCGADAVTVCRHCRRQLCAWHFAVQPVAGPDEDGAPHRGVAMARVCHPVCDAAWWLSPTNELRAKTNERRVDW